MDKLYDIAIIGGGVNGCGVARDAAGRGLKVILFERGDLAGATSSASTKLIHGGLRYLEQYDFRLVHEALSERTVMMRIAPFLVHPLRFILPHHKGLRPPWMLRAGLILYDNLGGRGGMPGSRALDLTKGPEGAPLKPEYRRGFSYYDCATDDARLVALNALSARELGAEVRTRTAVASARRDGPLWRITTETGEAVQARALVNAAGPWVNEAIGLTGLKPPHGVRLVQGTHIVVPRLYDHDAAYIFQNGDGRVVFAIPWRGDFTMIGTTDLELSAPPERAEPTLGEIDYLCRAVSDYFRSPLTPDRVVSSWAGVRALADDGAGAAQEASRDYVLTMDAGDGLAPMLSVYGGKITTYRRLAEGVMAKLSPFFASPGKPWTATKSLLGGELGGADAVIAILTTRYAALPAAMLRRLALSYGSRATAVLGEAKAMADLGEVFTGDLTRREVDYLIDQEFARTAEDVLWRRSKLGLHTTPDEVGRLEAYVEMARPRPSTSSG